MQLAAYIERGAEALLKLLRVQAADDETELAAQLRQSLAVTKGTTVEGRRAAAKRRLRP